MSVHQSNLSETSHGLFVAHKSYDPRIILFYFLVAAQLLLLAGGLAYQQLIKSDDRDQQERKQNHRRVLVPGPRGNIYARDGKTVLVGNRPRFSVVLHLDELRGEIKSDYYSIRKAYRKTGDKDIPNDSQLRQIARATVVQRYLDQVNRILKRETKVEPKALMDHFRHELLLPFTLIEDLPAEDYARLIERLPVRSPLQVYTSSTRFYPYGSAAAHTLGFIGVNPDINAEGLSGKDLKTFKMKGTIGRDGLEKKFDDTLQGDTGGSIFRVDPAGYRVNPPLEKRMPTRGEDLVTSLDIDLQLAAEQVIGDRTGTAVALDVRTGEVLALASKPDYNLADLSPRFSTATRDDIEARGAWMNQAVSGMFIPGSTYKILTTIAALRRGVITPDQSIVDCQGVHLIGKTPFVCFNRLGRHGEVLLKDAIAHSCDIYYYEVGQRVGPQGLAEEARRFHFDRRTGIELPNETGRMVVPDPTWKELKHHEKWFPGDTAHMAIGQGFVEVSPLQMACFIASVARNEVFTQPTLIHQENRPTQQTESIGLTSAQRAALLEGMEGCTTYGSAKTLTTAPPLRVPGVRIAGKTGTAQKKVTIDGKTGFINYAWFICFAPIENPEIAIAVMLEGDTIGENFGGGANAAPVASAVLKKYFEKKNRPATLVTTSAGP